MFAVIKTGGKQYRVAAEDVIEVEKLAGEPGDVVAFESVLMVGEGESATIGTPMVEGATVAGEVVEQTRGPKVIAFKKRRRKNSRRKHGHRLQDQVACLSEGNIAMLAAHPGLLDSHRPVPLVPDFNPGNGGTAGVRPLPAPVPPRRQQYQRLSSPAWGVKATLGPYAGD